MKLKHFSALSILVLFLTASTSSLGQNYPEVMFIMDASGSMQAPLQGRTKLDIAKEVMHRIIPDLPGEARVGLAAYGHRNPRDCRDVILIPPGKYDLKIHLKGMDESLPARNDIDVRHGQTVEFDAGL